MEGDYPSLGDLLTMVINHLLNGMIIQVARILWVNLNPEQPTSSISSPVFWRYLCSWENRQGSLMRISVKIAWCFLRCFLGGLFLGGYILLFIALETCAKKMNMEFLYSNSKDTKKSCFEKGNKSPQFNLRQSSIVIPQTKTNSCPLRTCSWTPKHGLGGRFVHLRFSWSITAG